MANFPEHTSLLHLEQAILNDINQYQEYVIGAQTQPQQLESTIHTKLAQIRALTRDLELLVEELDR